MSRRPRTVIAAAVLGMAFLSVPASAGLASPTPGLDLAGVRKATVAFHDPDAAAAAGYVPLLECIDMEGLGGMGQHLADLAAFDGTVDALHPEALVYEVRGDKLRLVAVEYIVPQSAWAGEDPPTLFGVPFGRNDALGIWALHAWIWRGNPLGTFADFNPNVRMCP